MTHDPDRNVTMPIGSWEETEALASVVAERDRLINLLRVVDDHITQIYGVIANGNFLAGERFASNDPIVKAIREELNQK